jgi:aspartate racemase
MMKEGDETYQNRKPIWGILGGMGPLASAGFIGTIYKIVSAKTEIEQQMSRVILISDPDIPDRTEAIAQFRNGDPRQHEEVKKRLKHLIKMLGAMDVDRIVIPCVTAHFFLPYLDLPSDVSSQICSLISTVLDALRRAEGKYILLRTNGTRDARIFEDYTGWHEVSHRIQRIEDSEQEMIHRGYLYKLKKKNVSAEDLHMLQNLMRKYDVRGFVAGCTEVHLHTAHLIANGISVIDPLQIIAQQIAIN